MNRPGETVEQKSHEELRRLVEEGSGEVTLEQLRRVERKVGYFQDRPEQDRYHSASDSVTILETYTTDAFATGAAVRKGFEDGRAKRLGPAAERKARDEQLFAWYSDKKKPDSRGRVQSDTTIIEQQGNGISVNGKFVRLSGRKLSRLKKEQQK